MSDYSFWHSALSGGEPETTPGTPHAGFYKNRRRITTENTDPKRKPGDPRKKVRTVFEPVAIWHDEAGWHCTIHRESGDVSYLTDQDAIDQVFSFCCRGALTYDQYLDMLPKETVDHE